MNPPARQGVGASPPLLVPSRLITGLRFLPLGAAESVSIGSKAEGVLKFRGELRVFSAEVIVALGVL
jgi:hypothetical protein